jgi:hypothetical protein
VSISMPRNDSTVAGPSVFSGAIGSPSLWNTFQSW